MEARSTASVRFYAELNRHLAASMQCVPWEISVDEGTTVATLLHSSGVPEGEVDLVLRNGEPARFDERISPGDRLSIYPVFETFDIGSVQRLRTHPLRTPLFVLDVHLGKLASFLRLLGFDATYATSFTDDHLVAISLREHRTLLSKDRALLRDPRLERAALVRADHPQEQLLEVVQRFHLDGAVRPFTRCLRCNVVLGHVERDTILELLPPRVRESQTEFTTCPACHRIYWKGSHHAKMSAFVSLIIDRCANPPEQTA